MATYTGGSGTAALTFSYTVEAGQRTPALAVTGYVMDGATIQGAAGYAADLTGADTTPIDAPMILGEAQFSDFSGDGTSDVLFRDPSTGALGDFLMNNGQPTWSGIGWADPSLEVAGVADIGGNGTSDILFRDPTSGALSAFTMSDNNPTWTPIGWADPSWQVVGVGDFTGNGTDDILFRDPGTGALGDFLMNNGQPTWSGIGWADPGLQVVGVGDFTGSGTDDILFRDPTGALSEFTMTTTSRHGAPSAR